MSKNETLTFLNSLQAFGWKLGLANITALLDKIGDPHKKLKCVHLAGSNGKGSTAVMLESILQQAGYRTGLYTSPHLVDVTERIRIDEKPVDFDLFSRSLLGMQADIREIGNTYFEALTAVAFQCFAEAEIDVAIVEVGLGGRFDATNVITPVLSVITQIDLEHTEHLGKTLSEIAFEKGGIIKKQIPCLIQSSPPEVSTVFQKICDERESALYRSEMYTPSHVSLNENFSKFDLVSPKQRFEDLLLTLPGRHQLNNAALAVAATDLISPHFPISKEHVAAGLKSVVWPGRLQKVEEAPKIVLDVAHNAPAVRQVMEAIASIYDYARLLVIVGILKDKDYPQVARWLAEHADHIFIVTPTSERALEAREFAHAFRNYSVKSEVWCNVNEGVKRARSVATEEDLILVTGSHFVVGEFLELHEKT